MEPGESLDETVEREGFEETGVRTADKRRGGFCDETVYERGAATHRHLITIYRIIPVSFEYRDSEEGTAVALAVQDIPARRAEISPSDYRMVERALFLGEGGFRARIEMERTGETYRILAESDVPA